MAAARYSSDVLEMFYGPISQEENARTEPPSIPRRGDFDFILERNNLDEWLRTWKMVVPFTYEFKADLLRFAQKTKSRFEEVVEYEIKKLKSVKTQFALNVRFSKTRDGEKEEMDHYFRQSDPAIFNKNNATTVREVLRRAIDEFKGQREGWSQSGSGWVVETVSDAYVICRPIPAFSWRQLFSADCKAEKQKSDH